MAARIGRVLLYVKDIEKSVEFYCKIFGFEDRREEGDRIVELVCPDGGPTIALHQAGKGLKQGQVLVKLVFDVDDVEQFCKQALEKGLEFGPIHKGANYAYANAKDPSKNSISISSKAFRKSID
ncbi:MAG: VOC family protein [Cohaesibacteraceae bacterium]|nr:VOC family protein [Cohaesibacteraceae bacterium]MBL4876126.1 VOC family protein [Cohaesibacteraceae bacterium]